MPFGTQIEWKIFRQVAIEEAQAVEEIFEVSIWFFYILAGLFFLLAIFYGPLLPIWMFINSLQLIVHIPLINVLLPAKANLFLLEHLMIVRLHISSLNEGLAELFGLKSNDS